MQAQNPEELFDLYAEDGTPLGRAKPRAQVHRDGDWHRSVHIWVVLTGGARGEGAPWVLFQQRSRGKDTWPGALDIAVTGHLTAGETVVDALREAREEIGLELGERDVVRLGLRKRVDTRTPGVLDRELQDIFVARVDRSIDAFRPDPAEVEALLALPLEMAGALFRGEIEEALGVRLAGGVIEEARVGRGDFVAADDGYYATAQRSVAAVVNGEEATAWVLGDAGPAFTVQACSAPARFIAAALQALAVANILYLAAHLLLDVVEGTRTAPPLAVALGLSVFSGMPWIGAELIRYLSTGTIALRPPMLVLELRSARYEIPLASITAIRPFRLPLPGAGFALVMTSGRRFRHRLLLADPRALLAALAEALPAAGRAAQHPTMAWAEARNQLARRRWWFWLIKYGLMPLALAVILFRLHQYIVYGGAFGQYQIFGLIPYLTSFATLWAGTLGGFVVYAVIVRALAELLALLATAAAPARARLVRRAIEGLCHVLYFGLIPAYFAARLLL